MARALSSRQASPRTSRSPSTSRRRRYPVLTAALAISACAGPAAAQNPGGKPISVGGVALQQLEPAPAGDALFSVPSPSIGGHLIPHVMVMFDYARDPLQLFGSSRSAIVSSQAFLRIDAALSLWDRLLVSFDVPGAVLQAGHDPGSPGVSYHVPSSAAFGDIRLGVRGRLLGAERGPISLGLGAYAFVPTGPSPSYAAEGAFRVEPHAIVGGEVSRGIPLVWSVSAGAVLRGSSNPHTFTFGGGIAFALWRERIRIGPEIYGALPFEDKPMIAAPGAVVTTRARVNAEALLGIRARLFEGIELGAAGGLGLSEAIGTPKYRVIALASWSLPERRSSAAVRLLDRDGDGIADSEDACPSTKGIASEDPQRRGCPKEDRDGDGVLDLVDACPAIPGPGNLDRTKNGCPPDRDHDDIADAVDACPDTAGVRNKDPKRNGCPEDRDGDGIPDEDDACPYIKGPRSVNRAQSGCPADADGDGLIPPDDACPFERGKADPNPQISGCPEFVRVRPGKTPEIELLRPIQFVTYGRERKEMVYPVPNEAILEIRSVIEQHPEFKKIEVQGHADDGGDPDFNKRVAEDRANAIYWWLVESGVPKDKLVARGYGDSIPIANNHTPEGRQKNRRVQFMVIEQQ